MNARWKQRPPESNWGEFRPDDQLGRLDYITPEKVKQGMAEVREGRVFNLSLPLDYPGGNTLNPLRHGRSRFLLTAPPLRLPGAVGSPVNPIATV